VPEVDNTYKARARALIQDAKKRAYSSKTTVALKNYLNEGAGGRIAGAAIGSIATSAASAGAVALAIGGGVALSAATFGIGPAVGAVLTYGLLKTLAELKYSGASTDLKNHIKANMMTPPTEDEADEREWAIKDPSLMVPGMLKVLKKLTRVKRRVDQLSGGAGGVLSTLRHAKTAAKAFLKNQGVIASNSRMFPSSGFSVTDKELNDRLFELQFYGQMLFNYVQKVIDSVAVRKRDEAVNALALIDAHIHRQVHFTGNHFACQNCYGMSEAEYRSRLRALGTGGSMTPNIQVKARSGADNSDNLMEALLKMQKNASLGGTGEAVNQKMARWGFRGGVSAPLLKSAASSSGEALGVLGQSAAPTVSAAAEGAGGGAGAGVVFAELMRTVSNRLTRRSVLKTARLQGAMDVLVEGNDARRESLQEFQKLLEGKDVLIRAPRVAEKCAHYIKKLDKIQQEILAVFDGLSRTRNFDRSAFHTCDEAYDAAFGFNYFYRNCEKFVAFLVYLEVLLLQVDLQVAKLGIGCEPGDVIKPDRATPPKPSTVA